MRSDLTNSSLTTISNSFANETNSLDLTTFGWNTTANIDEPIANMNAQLGTNYARNNISSLDVRVLHADYCKLFASSTDCNYFDFTQPNTYSGQPANYAVANNTKTYVMLAIADEAYLQTVLVSIKANVTSLTGIWIIY